MPRGRGSGERRPTPTTRRPTRRRRAEEPPRATTRCPRRSAARSRRSPADPRCPRCRSARSLRARPLRRHALVMAGALPAGPSRRACPSPRAPRGWRRRGGGRARRCPSASSSAVDLGLALEDVERGAGDAALLERMRQRSFVHDGAAARVHEVRRRLHERRARARRSGDASASVSGTWSDTTSAVASSSSSGIECTTPIPCASASRATAWPMRPWPTMPSVRPARPRPSMNVGAHCHVSRAAEEAIAFRDAAREREHQRDRHLGRRVGEHVGRVGRP